MKAFSLPASLVLIFALPHPAHAAAAAPGPRPNFLVIMADDLGYGDLGVYGGKDFATPRIDSIARDGIRFTNGYVSGPVCAPSRAGFMTGRYQDRFGFLGNPEPGAAWGLPKNETTLAAALKAAGYRTAAFGKWHLGEAPGYRPTDRGFDVFYGFLSGMHSYREADDPKWGPIVEGDAIPAPLPQYLTFELADRAIRFLLERQPGTRSEAPGTAPTTPFFVYLAFNAPHTPLEAPEEYLEKTKHLPDSKRRINAAMVMALDDAVGRVLDALEASGHKDNTLVVFLSDNGAALIPGSAENGGSNGPLRGSKAQLWEGGIRVPFLARWPGRIPAGRVVAEPVISLDLFPTFAALAGAQPPAAPDGLDIGPLLRGDTQTLPGRDLFWRFNDTQNAIRSGDWKWTRVAQDKGLFNLRQDIGESADLQEQFPERAGQLRNRWTEWDKKNLRQPKP